LKNKCLYLGDGNIVEELICLRVSKCLLQSGIELLDLGLVRGPPNLVPYDLVDFILNLIVAGVLEVLEGELFIVRLVVLLLLLLTSQSLRAFLSSTASFEKVALRGTLSSRYILPLVFGRPPIIALLWSTGTLGLGSTHFIQIVIILLNR
jgi:hypothetical protein